MKLVVIGTGYVGLVTGACFAEMGNEVVCVDKDVAKVSALRQGKIPIYEPGLETMVRDNAQAGRLSFATQLASSLPGASMAFIAVGTPSGADGRADLSQVLAVAAEIGQTMQEALLVVNKSTVPVGTGDQVSAILAEALRRRGLDLPVEVASNPEFLKEGAAIDDFMRPDRIIVGTEQPRARALMETLYAPFMRNHHKLMFMGRRDAELCKYAANAMLATKISFINEMALLAESLGADIEQVRQGIGADQRIGYHFIYPGCGYGGSCFPKDVKAILAMAKDAGLQASVMEAVEARNQAQKDRLFEKLQAVLGDLSQRRIAVWGLAFKPGTDDIREAPASRLLQQLLHAGAQVFAHDPVAMENSAQEFSAACATGQLSHVDDPYAALVDADALVLVTEWKPYRQPDFLRIRQLLRTPLIIDGRNLYPPASLREQGFIYHGIGR